MAENLVHTIRDEFNPEEEGSLPLNTLDLYRSSIGFKNDRFRCTFNSNNLNFDEEKESFANKQLFSPRFTKRYESQKSDIDELGAINQDHHLYVDKERKGKHFKKDSDFILVELEQELNHGSLSLVKRKSEQKRLFNTKMYSQLKFTHKNIDLAETYFESEKLEHKSSQSSLKENKMRNLKLNFASMEDEEELDKAEEIVKYSIKIIPPEIVKNNWKIGRDLKLKSKLVDLNCLGIDFTRMSPESIGELVISKISKLQEGETLILPDTYFSVNYLHIKQNCTIKGKESTTMSVLGKILIGNFDENISDESEQSNLSEKVQVFFSEIYIKFNPIIRIQSQQFSRKSTCNAWEEEQTFPAYYLFENSSAGDMRKDESLTSLMVLSGEGVRVEMRDCMIENSIPFGSTSSSIVTELKTCVFSTIEKNSVSKGKFNSESKNKLNTNVKMDDNCSIDESDDGSILGDYHQENAKPPTILLYSSVFMKFNTMFKIADDSKLLIEGCFMENFKENCVMLANPKLIKLINSKITHSEMSGVTISWSDSVEETQKCKAIEIEGCEITNNNINGVEIYCDSFVAQNLSVEIKNSKISENKENGVFIARIALTELVIHECKIINNGSKGLVLRSVHSKNNMPKFTIYNSKINKNKEIGILLEDSGAEIGYSECCNNFRHGICIIGTNKPAQISNEVINFLIKRPMNINIESMKINENKCCGVTSTNFWKGKISIAHSSISMNCEDGVMLSNTFTEIKPRGELSQSSSSSSMIKGTKAEVSLITQKAPLKSPHERCCIDDSIISSNKKNGVSMKHITLELNKITMLDNKLYAVLIERIQDKYRFLFPQADQMQSNVKGKIGGEWGLVNKKKTSQA